MTQLNGPVFDGLYGDLIMEHYRSPRNRDPLADATFAAYELNPFCGDLIDLQLRLDGAGAVDRVFANSEGCSIIQASASMMSDVVKGKTVEEIGGLSRRFRSFLRSQPKDDARSQPGPRSQPEDDGQSLSALGDLRALGVVRRYPVRIKCALLPWTALEEAIRQR